MKKLIVLVVLPMILFMSNAHGKNFKSIARELDKVETERVTQDMEGKGLETFDGKLIDLEDVKKRFFRKKTIKEVLERSQIELNNGRIFYPEEIRFALVPRGEKGKVPHGDEKAPHTPN